MASAERRTVRGEKREPLLSTAYIQQFQGVHGGDGAESSHAERIVRLHEQIGSRDFRSANGKPDSGPGSSGGIHYFPDSRGRDGVQGGGAREGCELSGGSGGFGAIRTQRAAGVY